MRPGRRAGRQVIRNVRGERIRSLQKNWRLVATVVVLWISLAVIGFAGLRLLGSGAGQVGFFLGVMTASGVATLVTPFALDGSMQRRMGGEAEKWTTKELRRLGDGWTVFDAIRFEHHDVDHVAVGRTRILVVETKWRRRWELGETGLPRLDPRHLHQAKKNAEQIERMLRRTKEPLLHQPVLFVWGPGLRDADSAWFTTDDGVMVVIGDRAGEWRERISARWESRANHAARQELANYLRRRDAQEIKSGAGPLRRLAGL